MLLSRFSRVRQDFPTIQFYPDQNLKKLVDFFVSVFFFFFYVLDQSIFDFMLKNMAWSLEEEGDCCMTLWVL